MAYEVTSIGQLIASNPKQAARALIELLEHNGGNSVHAALEVGVHHATLKRWVARLDPKFRVRKKLEAMRKRATPVTMSAERREQLEVVAAENRRVAGLQRMFDRLKNAELAALAKEAKVPQWVLAQWRGDPGALGDARRGRVEAGLHRLQGLYRAQVRATNQAKKKG